MTLHLERTSSYDDRERAVDILASIAGVNVSRPQLYEALDIMFAAKSPMEIRVGSLDAAPLLVVYPTTRVEGEQRIEQDKLAGERMVTVVRPRVAKAAPKRVSK